MSTEQSSTLVVVIDDDPAQLALMGSVLKTIGLQALCLNGPMGATNTVAKSGAILIILDVSMPGIDGKSLLGLLHKDSRTASIPVLLFSGQSVAELRAIVQNTHAVGFIQKGEELSSMVAKIKGLTASHLG